MILIVTAVCGAMAVVARQKSAEARLAHAEGRLSKFGAVFAIQIRTNGPPRWLKCLLGERYFDPRTAVTFYPDAAATDDDMDDVVQVRTLRWLNLCNTVITDRGLEKLTMLPELSYVDLRGTAVTESGVAEFRRRLPRCEVVVGASPMPAPWAVLQRRLLERDTSDVLDPKDVDEIWELFASNPWFRAEIARQAQAVLAERHCSLGYQADVEREALLGFRARFQNQPDLGIRDPSIDATFPEFIADRLRCFCNDAIGLREATKASSVIP